MIRGLRKFSHLRERPRLFSAKAVLLLGALAGVRCHCAYVPPLLQEHFKSSPELEACRCKCFRIEDDILDSPLGSLMILNAVLANVQNQDDAEVWKERFAKVWEEKQASGLDLKTDPKAMAFDSFVKTSGLPSTKKRPQSSMAMLKRCYRGSRSFSVSPLVDFYNSLSLAHCVSCGGFDVEDLPGPFTKTVCILCIYSM